VTLVFFGSGAFGRATLAALVAAGFLPPLVVTQPARRRRRRGKPEPTPVERLALESGCAVFAPASVNDDDALERLRATAADLFVVAEYGQILGRALLEIPPSGAINVHASLLPRHRGATPVAAAILAGDTETGITIQRVVRKLDAGPVLAARAVPVLPEDDAGSLTARLATLGGELAVEVVRAFAAGSPPPERPQDEAQVTTCRRLRPGDAWVDWTRSAIEIERFVRALRPEPGAHARLDRDPPLDLQLLQARPVDGEGVPGVLEGVERAFFDVGTGSGLLRILEVVPASRKPMTARAFLNGYRLTRGERFLRTGDR